jgi:hypothetical protein
MREARNAFWTLTAWAYDAAMNSYRTQDAHREALPKLIDWCDESSVVHWTQETRQLPSLARGLSAYADTGEIF